MMMEDLRKANNLLNQLNLSCITILLGHVEAKRRRLNACGIIRLAMNYSSHNNFEQRSFITENENILKFHLLIQRNSIIDLWKF